MYRKIKLEAVMFFFLSGALTNKVIEELRSFWAYHPKYREDLVDNIQGKFAFTERPQRGMIVKANGGSHNSLSADNFKGTIYSYAYLCRINKKPGISVEWVREDSVAIQKNGGKFPSPSGVYYAGIEADVNGKPELLIDPLLDVRLEQVSFPDGFNATLNKTPLPTTLYLTEMPTKVIYKAGVDYVLNGDAITLTDELTGGKWVQASYRYIAPTLGPFPIREMYALNHAIPGVTIAFGRRVEIGDQFAVAVHHVRMPAAQEYGGRWQLSVDVEVFARDLHDAREIMDTSATYMFGIARPRLSTHGIEIVSISLGGEAEESYDDTGDEYFYTGNFTLEIETEWSIHVPIPLFIREVDQNFEILSNLGLTGISDPFWSGRKGTFEVIK